jgi:adenylate kinase family enzyme
MQLLEQHGAKHGSSAVSSLGQEAVLDLMHQYGKIRDGQLSMDWHDVRDLLRGIGEEPTDDVVKKLFEVADVDGKGVIDTEAFIANSDTFLGGRPARIILIVGGPGSGKGLLSERLVKECGVVHLSSGDLLRDEVAKGTVLGKQVEEIMKSGGLVSSAIMVTLMKKKMKDHPGKRILLDGFPRSQENAQDLVALCGKPELALQLACDDTVLIERIMKRGLSGERADDNLHTAIERIRTYHKYHHVTLDFLREENVPIVFLDCSATPDGVWEQLRAIGRLMRTSVRLPNENYSEFEIP